MDIITAMQSSVAMQRSCTRRPRQCFFPVNKVEKGKEEEEEEEENGRRKRWISELHCSLPMQCSRIVLVSQGICFFPVNKVEKEVEEEEQEEEEEEVDIRTTMQSSVAMQQNCTRWPRKLFPVNKV